MGAAVYLRLKNRDYYTLHKRSTVEQFPLLSVPTVREKNIRPTIYKIAARTTVHKENLPIVYE